MASLAESTATPAAAPLPPHRIPLPNPLDSWTERRPLRETFLMHFRTEGLREALEAVGELVFNMTLAYNDQQPEPETEEIELVEVVRAVAADLRYLQGLLHYAAMETGVSVIGHAGDKRLELWLLGMAGTWADSLSEIAAEMEGAVAE